jgi:hypothetical protein
MPRIRKVLPLEADGGFGWRRYASQNPYNDQNDDE